MRIALIVFSLRSGGAERVASTLVNGWAKAGDQATLVSFETPAKDFYSLEPSVKRLALGLGHAGESWLKSIVNNVRRVKRLRAILRTTEFDVVVSFGDKINILTLLATLGSGVPIIVAEHNDPTRHFVGAITTCLRRLLYRRARMVVVLTPGIGLWARRIVRTAMIRVIPNPLDEQFTKQTVFGEENKSPSVVAMGRLVPQKGFDLLLRAFANCVDRHPEWSLRIFGEGSERDRLLALAAELGITARLDLRPVTKEPEKVLRESSLFVLSSRYEGFPMALLEAMACGLPVISFDCQSGPREMISDGVNGILVPPGDIRALADAMNRLMESERERRALSARAVEIVDRFGFSPVNAMWRNLFAEVGS